MQIKLYLCKNYPYTGDSPGKMCEKIVFFHGNFAMSLSQWVLGVGWCLYLSWKCAPGAHFQLKYRHQPQDLHGECAVYHRHHRVSAHENIYTTQSLADLKYHDKNSINLLVLWDYVVVVVVDIDWINHPVLTKGRNQFKKLSIQFLVKILSYLFRTNFIVLSWMCLIVF